MKATVFLPLLICGLATAAAPTDILVDAGRWEVSGEIQYGPNRMPGMPASETFTDVHCLTEAQGIQVQAPLPLMAADCKLTNYRRQGNSVSFTASCEGTTLDMTLDSRATQFSASAITRGGEPEAQFKVNFRGKRTGPSCSAAERKAYEEK